MLLVAGVAASVAAQDTSPYLVSDWYTDTRELDEYVSWFVVNPTPVRLAVYAAFYNYTGSFSGCVYSLIDGNDTWWLTTRSLPFPVGENPYGTAKFFAFPALPNTAPKFDPNAVIGGFKQTVDCDYILTNAYTETIPFSSTVILVKEYDWIAKVSEANMKAVTINSATIGEFQALLARRAGCVLMPGTPNEYISPRDYCATLPPPPEQPQ